MALSRRLASRRFPYLPLVLRIALRPSPVEIQVEALVDTGFDGEVVVPATLAQLAAEPHGHLRWRLADGSMILCPFYTGTAQLDAIDPSRSRSASWAMSL